MSEKERSLKNILINKAFQLKLLSYFVGLFIISTISLYSTTYLFFWNMKNKGISVGIPPEHIYYQFLNNQKQDLDILFLGLAAFNFILLLFIGCILSHRIAGPLNKLFAFLKKDNTQSEFKLRKDDFFKELEPFANELKEKIK